MNRFLIALATKWDLYKTRKELHALSDHMLRDIGLRRDQLAGFCEDLKKKRPGFPGCAQI
jgi:hypothetical protein